MLRRSLLLMGSIPLLGCQFRSAGGSLIKVGILHSLTGTLALSEKPVVEATLLAIDAINAQGGLLGKRIEPIVVDGASDALRFAQGAEQLITQGEVVTIFGCWTSASRKTVLPIFEKYNHLLIYPVQYEGLEASPNIVYTGAAPNQQIIPAVKWASRQLGKRVFLVGSDYVFPRTANTIVRAQMYALGGEVLGEEYVLLGSRNVQSIVNRIVASRPDVILNTINGDSNIAFFSALRSAGISPQDIPTVSFSIAESELTYLDAQALAGDYAAWNYFQSIASPANQAFVQQFQAKYGADRVISDPMEAAYLGVHLWAQAITEAQTTHTPSIRNALRDQSFAAPEGVVYIDPNTQHTWKTVRIGQIRGDGQFDIVWSSDRPIRPNPYPSYRSQGEWGKYLAGLYQGWGNRWANPG